jgi:xanthine dehydrogenase accessory factor
MTAADTTSVWREIWPFIAGHRAANRPVALARLVGRDGPGARPLGSTMAIAADGTWRGSLSGGCVEGTILDAAATLAAGDGAARLISVLPGADLMPWESGPACSGELRVLLTPVPPEPVRTRIAAALDADTGLAIHIALLPPFEWRVTDADTGPSDDGPCFREILRRRRRLVLIGATDLAAELARLAAPLHRSVVVLDPRPRYLASGAFPVTTTLERAWGDDWLAEHPLRPGDAVVALSHDPRIDDRVLRAALAGPAGYVAALGSRATHAQRLRRLHGTPWLARLTGPVGLDLGGASSAETALSILSEIVAVSHGRAGGPLRDTRHSIHHRTPTLEGCSIGPWTSTSCATC